MRKSAGLRRRRCWSAGSSAWSITKPSPEKNCPISRASPAPSREQPHTHTHTDVSATPTRLSCPLTRTATPKSHDDMAGMRMRCQP
eukprot:1729041-Rhodomonas_salina.1